MKRSNGNVWHTQTVESRTHLPCCSSGEGHRECPSSIMCTGSDRVSDAMCDRPRLARPRPGQYYDGAIDCTRDFTLFRVESGQDVLCAHPLIVAWRIDYPDSRPGKGQHR